MNTTLIPSRSLIENNIKPVIPLSPSPQLPQTLRARIAPDPCKTLSGTMYGTTPYRSSLRGNCQGPLRSRYGPSWGTRRQHAQKILGNGRVGKPDVSAFIWYGSPWRSSPCSWVSSWRKRNLSILFKPLVSKPACAAHGLTR